MKNEMLTQSDVKKIEEEIKYRKLEVRKKALEDVKTARAHGDLSENFEYYAAKKFNRENNSRIEYLEKMLKNAKIIDDRDNGGVSLNNSVKVKFVMDDREEENWDESVYKIVTSIRADSINNKISIESPLGKALVGKKENDISTVILENGSTYKVKIIEIIKTNDDTNDKIRQF